MKATAGEVYTVYNQYLKRYTACQVAYIASPDTVSEESWAVVLSLDWVGDAPLTADELPHLRPLYKDFMYWSRDLHLLRVPLEVPPQYKLVGTLPPFTDQPCRSYGGWSDGYDVYLQIRWQAIPEERRRAFKEAMESDEQTEIGGIPVKVSSHRVTDQYEPFDSALELKALPCLSTLICERWHPDLLEFLQENPFIDEMTLLSHGQRTLDLRGTSIRKLMLDMTGLEELWLCEGTELLLFQNKGPDACAIHAPEDGSSLTLQFIGEYCPHTELPNLRGLHGIGLKDFDLTRLAAVHPHLKELRLWGAPGNLGNFSAVEGFRELTNLSTFDLFGFGAADIPTPEQMPELRWFWMTSLPETAAKAAKQLWKSKPGMDLRITKPRKPEWLAQNLDNPFRGWDGAEHKHGDFLVDAWQPEGQPKYTRQWLQQEFAAGRTRELCLFWGHQPSEDDQLTRSCLSQWWMEDFYTTADSYLCMEQYMMAAKAELFGDKEIRDQILKCSDQKQIKALGRKVQGFDQKVWDKFKYAIVLLGNWHKFSQNRDLREFLLSTGDSVLVEASPYDAIWGIRLAASSPEAQDPMKWRGQNLLGFALMEVRDELRRVTQNEMLCDWSMVWQQ